MRKAKLLRSDWQTSRYGVSKYPLLLAGDRLIGYADGSMFALDIYTGKEVISELGPDQEFGLPYSGKCSEPIHGNGGVYFMDRGKGKGKNKDVLVALRLADGLPLPGWKSPKITNVTWMSGTTHPTDPYLGVIVVANSNSRGETSVSGYDMKDGRKLWGPIPMENRSIGKIGLGTDNIYFIAGSELTAVETKFGDVRWRNQLGMDISENPTTFDTLNQEIAPQVVGDRAICVGSMLHAVETEKGKHIWCAALGAQQSAWVQPVIDAKLNILIAASQGIPKPDGSVKGEVRCIELSSGRTKWTATIDGDPGVPAIAGNSVYVHSRQENVLHAFDLVDPTKRPRFVVDKVALTIPAVIGNGTLFIPTENGEIHAKSFAEQNAAYFNGNARIDIVPDGEQFTFSNNCLTMEAWVHSTEGGDIVTGFPLESKDGSECFRFNLSKNGELGFAILSPDQRNMDLMRSQPTKANDGLWHHVAVTWETGKASLYLDGFALDTTSNVLRNGTRLYINDIPVQPDNRLRRDWLSNPRPAPLTLHGQNTLTIGAFRDGTTSLPKHNFNGLLREVRIWDKALSVNTLKSRMTRVVGPLGDKTKANEALLLGNWHLNGNMKGKKTRIANDVYLHSFSGEPQELASRVTDLILDDSAFPFLLDHVVEAWPDIDHWSSRGEHPIENPAAIAANGVLSFGTGTAIYGIEEESGTRCWSVPTATGASKPVAYRDEFFAMTGKNDLIQIDAESGGFQTVYSFGEAIGTAEQKLSSPAASDIYLAAAGRNGKIWVWERTKPKSAARTFSTASSPGDLSLSEGILSFVTGEGPDHKLYTIDLTQADAQPLQITVQSDVFFAHLHSVFYMDENHALASRDRRGVVRRSPSLSPEVTSQIIGLAASMDDDLLVAVTKSGALYGLSHATLAQRWVAKFPAPPRGFKARATLHDPARSPIIKNGIAYCSHANSVVAFDGKSGEYRGLFKAPHEVTTALTVNDDGTVYFGGAPETGRDRLDGALHSAVFGRTAALRLGIDVYGALSTSPNYLIVSDPKPKTALSLMNVSNCCVEAWINTKQTGEILSICPSSTQRFGLQLSVGATGKVQFTTWQLEADASWKALKASTSADSSKAVDGQWHHIAVSCQRKPANEGYDVRIYLDGDAQTVVSEVSTTTPDAIVKGLYAYIGADVTKPAHSPAHYFRGLIGDLRIWDTYMTASEISERIQVKLRGTEPSLAAYWNFALGTHDESPSAHDAEFAFLPLGAGGTHVDPTFWLTGLSFDQPAYPFLTTSAIITQIGEEGSADVADDLLKTIYELTITAHAADGSPLKEHVLDLWYVKHPDETDLPETITLQSSTDSQPIVLHAVLPDHELLNRKAPGFDEKKLLKAKNSFTRSTNAKGQLVLTVVTKLPSHGPSLDLHAAFMPSNQRFHVNVLNENQALEIPNPPFLSAQSTLIQDYHYTSGGVIDESRSREVYRTILTAQDANGMPRPRERFELWAIENVEIEVGQMKYTINAQNSQAFRADELGTITIDVAATELKMPDLSVWAGFMHRGERTTVSVDQDAQAKLSTVTGSAMSDKNRMTNWKKGSPAKGALLKDDYHVHSDKISESIRHLSSAAQPAEHQSGMRTSSHLLGSDVLLRTGQKAVLMHQNELPVRGDTVRLIRTQRHIMRAAPITPEAVLKSLAESHTGSDEEVIGFEIDFTKLNSNANSSVPDFSVNYLTRSHGAQYMMMAAPGVGALSLADSHWKVGWQGGELAANLSHNLGGWFDDALDWCEGAIDSALDEIKKIAIIVGETVMVAVNYATEIVCEVVNTVGDALRYVGEFLYKLAIMIIDVIKFMMFLFDWGAIVETHNILRSLFKNGTSYVAYQINQLKDEIPKSLHSMVDTVMDALGGGSSNLARFAEPAVTQAQHALKTKDNTQDAGAKEASSVPSSMLVSRSKNFTPSNVVQMLHGGSENEGMRMVVDFLKSIAEAIPDLISGDFEGAGNRIVTALKRLVEEMMDAVVSIVEQALQTLAESLTSMIDKLANYTLDIPFVGSLYKWIVGTELTFLSLVALVMAIPVNLVYGVITGLTSGTLRHFNEDARDLHNAFKIPVKGLGGASLTGLSSIKDDLPWAQDSSFMMDIIYTIVRTFYAIATYATDMLFVAELAGVRSGIRSFFKIIKGLTGIASSGILYMYCIPSYLEIVKEKIPETDFKYVRIFQVIGFSLGIMGDLTTFALGMNGCFSGLPKPDASLNRDAAGRWEGEIKKDSQPGGMDRTEGVFLSFRSVGLTIFMLYMPVKLLFFSEEFKRPDTTTLAFAYFLRDWIGTIPKVISPAYTQWGQEFFTIPASWYPKLAGVRALTNGVSIGAHFGGALYQDNNFGNK